MTEIVIIGGGAAGMSTAVHALELGAKVTVVERSYPGAESTGASAGVFTTSYRDDFDVALRVWSMACFQRWRTQIEIPFTRTGFLRLAHDSDSGQFLAEAVATQRRHGVADATMLDAAELESLIPHLQVEPEMTAMWCPSDGYTDGHVLCTALADWVRSKGGRIVRGIVVGHRKTDRHEVELAGGDVLTADVIVNAAGGWAPKVGKILGHEIELVTERHQLIFVKLPRDLDYVMPFVMDYIQGSGTVGVYFRQEGRDRLLAGLHTNDVGLHEVVDPDDYSRRSDDDVLEEVGEQILRLLPTLDDAGLQAGYAGIYPHSPDGLPIVGPFRADPSIVACTGGGGVGVMLSPVMGRLAAEYAVGHADHCVGSSDLLLPDRFVS
ncbi:FAD-binding oxidoreductase [Mycolicibacterium sp. YH-1]|uniref:NAD(P)/FAD-dependent oxidoreductase n=1 Tax=Mycolicibacterium sp. YH-1 TaxID=2908837 RepID=UPI001F4C500E|nr:FAD-binding oxidoreductase [Mycolicibacterium sp. YH-1]UNB53137.1 FAD-binding oxidoreductase [Mycolicibacterium sp. YH-1]